MRLALNTTYVLFTGQVEFLYERRRGAKVDFLSADTNERLTFTDEELADYIASGRGKLFVLEQGRRPAAAIADPEQRSAEDKAEAMRRFRYAMALYKEFGHSRIPNFLLEQVVARTADSLGDPEPPHCATVRVWRVRAGSPPTLARLFTNNAAKGNRTDRLATVRPIIVKNVSAFYLKREERSVAEVHRQISTEITLKNRLLPPDQRLDTPSRVAVDHHIGRLDLRDVTEAREGREAARRKYDPVVLRERPEAPLDIVELDHTLADLFVISDEHFLPIGRPWICIAIDKCTLMPLGLYVGFEPPSVHTVMQTLRNAILPKKYLNLMKERYGWRIQHSWDAFGIPRLLSVDRAAENFSEDIEVLACSIGVQLHYCPGRKPHYKADIENLLGNVNRSHLQQQRGTTFSNVIARGDYDPAKNALITFSELRYILHLWLIDVYARTVKSGLIDIPAKLWERKTDEYPIQPLHDCASLDHLFGRSRRYTLQTTGIIRHHLQYIAPELVALLRSPKFHAAAPDHRVLCRWDPADISVMYVLDPLGGNHIRVPAVDQKYTVGLSEYEHRCIMEYRKKKARDGVDEQALCDARVEMSRILQSEWRTAKGSNKRNARSLGIGRLSPSGEDAEPLLESVSSSAPPECSKRPSSVRPKEKYPSDDLDVYADAGEDDDDF